MFKLLSHKELLDIFNNSGYKHKNIYIKFILDENFSHKTIQRFDNEQYFEYIYKNCKNIKKKVRNQSIIVCVNSDRVIFQTGKQLFVTLIKLLNRFGT